MEDDLGPDSWLRPFRTGRSFAERLTQMDNLGRSILLTASLIGGFSELVTAAPISFLFKGVTIPQPDGITTPFDGGTFEALVTFDMHTADTSPASDVGSYFNGIESGYLSIHTATNDYLWTINPSIPNTNEILIQNLPNVDFLSFGPGIAGPAFPAGFGATGYFLLQLWDDTAAALDSDNLPKKLDVTDFTRTNLQLTLFGDKGSFDAASLGQITSITRVPEPSALALVGSSLIVGVLRRRRRIERN